MAKVVIIILIIFYILIVVVILILPANPGDYRNHVTITTKVILSGDLYRELQTLSTPNWQKRYYFKLFCQ
jgi:hypothetical protein